MKKLFLSFLLCAVLIFSKAAAQETPRCTVRITDAVYDDMENCVTLNLVAENNSYKPIDGDLIVAHYSGEGRLIGHTGEYIGLWANEEVEVSVSIYDVDPGMNSKVKVFLWNNLEGLVPLSETCELNSLSDLPAINNYYFLQAVGFAHSGLDAGGVQFACIDTKGERKIYKLAKRVTFIEGDSRATNYVTYPSAVPQNFAEQVRYLYDIDDSRKVIPSANTYSLIKCSFNSNREINRIYIPSAPDPDPYSVFGLCKIAQGENAPYYETTQKLGNTTVGDDTLVYYVSQSKESSFYNVEVGKAKDILQNGCLYNYKAYALTPQGVLKIIVLDEREYFKGDIVRQLVVDEVTVIPGGEGGQIRSLSGYHGSEYITINARAGLDLSDLEPGDVILTVTNEEGELDSYTLLFGAKDAPVEKNADDGLWQRAHDIYNDMDWENDDEVTEVFGFVARKQNNAFYLTENYVSEFSPVQHFGNDIPFISVPVHTPNINYYEVDLTTSYKNVRVSSFAYTIVNLIKGKIGSYAYIRLYDGVVTDVVVYNMINE